MRDFHKKSENYPSREKKFLSNNRNNSMLSNTNSTRNKQSNASIRNKGNNSNTKAVVGNWIGAVGTIISAISSTPSTVFTEQTLEDFNLIGNTLQAVGSAIVAETEDTLINEVGGQIAAVGNLASIAGILSKNEQLNQRLEKQGELLQLVGVGITVETQGNLTLIETIANTGVIIQVIGIAIGVLVISETSEGKVIGAVGAWIEAVGAVITALAIDKMNVDDRS